MVRRIFAQIRRACHTQVQTSVEDTQCQQHYALPQGMLASTAIFRIRPGPVLRAGSKRSEAAGVLYQTWQAASMVSSAPFWGFCHSLSSMSDAQHAR